MFTRLVFVFAG